MAIKKSIEINDSGVMAEYIKIEFAVVGSQSPGIQVGLFVYKDQASRDAGKNAVETVTMVIPEEGAAHDQIMDTIYRELKKLAKFSGAEDV